MTPESKLPTPRLLPRYRKSPAHSLWGAAPSQPEDLDGATPEWKSGSRRFRSCGGELMKDCQTFRRGCCGCCVNMSWSDEKILQFLKMNTAAAARILPSRRRPGYRHLVRLHLSRGGFRDHLLLLWLAIPTFGLSAWFWKRILGSCRFAGYIDEDEGRVGCLVHPLRVGSPDLRKHAFPLIPTVSCNRSLRCPMLDDGSCPDPNAALLSVSRAGSTSMRQPRKKQKRLENESAVADNLRTTMIRQLTESLRRRLSSLPVCSGGGVLMEYVIVTLMVVGPLVGAGEQLFNIQGFAEGDVENFGFVGRMFVGRWRMIMCGIGLPLP